MKKRFTVELGRLILKGLLDAPESQISADLKRRCAEFIARHPTPLEMFEFLNSLAADSCCNTSSFVKVLCDVQKFYLPPESGDAEEDEAGSAA